MGLTQSPAANRPGIMVAMEASTVILLFCTGRPSFRASSTPPALPRATNTPSTASSVPSVKATPVTCPSPRMRATGAAATATSGGNSAVRGAPLASSVTREATGSRSPTSWRA